MPSLVDSRLLNNLLKTEKEALKSYAFPGAGCSRLARIDAPLVRHSFRTWTADMASASSALSAWAVADSGDTVDVMVGSGSLDSPGWHWFAGLRTRLSSVERCCSSGRGDKSGGARGGPSRGSIPRSFSDRSLQGGPVVDSTVREGTEMYTNVVESRCSPLGCFPAHFPAPRRLCRLAALLPLFALVIPHLAQRCLGA